jgi:hypothetical protein
VPGYGGTTVELAEIARVETLRLLETVIKTELEREEYMSKLNCGVTPRPTLSVGSVAEVKDPPEKAEPKEASAEVKEKREPPQKQTFEQSESQTIKIPSLTEVTVKPAETITLKEAKITGLNEIASTKLRLGEPFAQYENFEACVAANQDKENPESYCGKIKHETEEIVNLKANVKQITAKLNELVQEINKPVTLTLPEVKMPQDDLSWKDSIVQVQEQFKAEIEKVSETVKALPQDDLGWKEVKPYDDTPLKEMIESSKYNDAPIKELIEANRFNPAGLEQKIVEVDAKITETSKTLDSKIAEVKTAIPTVYNDQPIKEQITAIKPYDDTAIKTELAQAKEALKEITQLKETVAKQKQDFDALLDSSDKAVKEYFVDIKKQRESDQQKIKELENKIQEYEQKKVSETKTLEVRVDNLEDKLQPEYKGHGKRETVSSAPLTHDPTTGKPRQ